MASSNLIRLGGLAVVVGGAASATLGELYVLQARGVSFGAIEDPLRRGNYEYPALTMLLASVLVAIALLHVLHRESYGWWGTVGSLTAFAGVGMIAGGNVVGELVPASVTVAMGLLAVGVVMSSVGTVALGIMTITARVLPRWCGAAVIAGSPPFVFIWFMVASFVEAGLHSLGLSSGTPGGMGWGALWASPGLAWALVGYAVFRAGRQRAQQLSGIR